MAGREAEFARCGAGARRGVAGREAEFAQCGAVATCVLCNQGGGAAAAGSAGTEGWLLITPSHPSPPEPSPALPGPAMNGCGGT